MHKNIIAVYEISKGGIVMVVNQMLICVVTIQLLWFIVNNKLGNSDLFVRGVYNKHLKRIQKTCPSLEEERRCFVFI